MYKTLSPAGRNLAEIPGARTLVGAALVLSVAVAEGVSAPRRRQA